MTQQIDAVDFPDTPWSLLAKQAAGDGDDQTALRELLELYWQPVFCALRDGWQLTSDDAGSLCDQFLADLLAANTIDAAEPHSRFRLHVRAELARFMGSNPKPNPQSTHSGISIDTSIGADRSPGEPENVFDQRWMLVVYRRALERTKERLSDNPDLYQLLLETDVESSNDARPDVADEDELRLARTAFRRELVELVYQSVSNLDDAQEELRWLLR